MIRRLQKCLAAVVLMAPMLLGNSHASQRFGIDAAVGLTAMYDTNVTQAHRDEQGDFISILTPRVEGEYLLRFGEVAFGYKPRVFLLANNFDNSAFKRIAHDAGLDIAVDLTGRMRLTLSDSYSAQSAALTRPALAPNNIVHANVVTAQLAYELPLSQKMQADLRFKGGRSDVFSFNSDRFGASAEFKVMREITERFSAGVGGNLAMLFYDDPVFPDVTIYGGNGRIEYEIVEALTFSLPVGIQQLRLTGVGQTETLHVDAELTSRQLRDTAINLGFGRGFTVDTLGNNFDQWTMNLGVNTQLSREMNIKFTADFYQYYKEDLVFTTINDILIEFGATLAYLLRPNLEVNGGLKTFFNRGESGGNDYNVFQPFIGITYDFSHD